jgi:hypothetical protein
MPIRRGLIKLQVARAGPGETGGYRMLIAFRSRLRAVFLFALPEQLTTSRTIEVATLRETAALWLAADAQKIAWAVMTDF